MGSNGALLRTVFEEQNVAIEVIQDESYHAQASPCDCCCQCMSMVETPMDHCLRCPESLEAEALYLAIRQAAACIVGSELFASNSGMGTIIAQGNKVS